VERFRREARIAAGLSHPNLVKVYDFGSDAERPFLVMEYIEGAALSRESTVGAGVRVDSDMLARELLDALMHIHEAGIVHRDIKPANVLVGPDGRPRLTDFGIALSDDSTELTETGQVIGTLRYLAPEVARGQPATARSDLYSLGVLLSEVAGGDESPSLARLIDRLTAADPSSRPASAAQALSALDGAADVTATTRALGATAHHRFALLAMGVAAGLAAVIVLIVIATAGGGGNSSASTVRVAPANAPLSQQLDTLDRMVNRVSGH
ncbi:MAG: serine/threonine-protein kinase, partial [Solirubrobacteraceae bacterium]